MGYRDPKTRIHPRMYVTEDACEHVAQLAYGVPYFSLPEALRNRVFQTVAGSVQPRDSTSPGRRFDSYHARWTRQDGWRTERARDQARLTAERLAAIEVRKLRTQRKAHARRLAARRPDRRFVADEEM